MDDLFLFLDFTTTAYYTADMASLEIHILVFVFPFLIVIKIL